MAVTALPSFKSKRPGVCYVYFILARGANAVKIGVAHDLQQRVRDLQTANPLTIELLASVAFEATMEGRARQFAMEAEQSLHKRFDSLRLRGEWFLFGKDIRRLVSYVIATGQLEDGSGESSRIWLENVRKIYAAEESLPVT